MCRPDDAPPYPDPAHDRASCPACHDIAMSEAVRAEDDRINARTPRDDSNPMEE